MCSSCVQAGTRYSGGKKGGRHTTEGENLRKGSRKVVRVTDVNDGGRFRECGEEYEVCQDKFCLSSAVVCGKVLVHTRKKEFSKQKSRQQSTIPQMTAGRTTWFHELKSKDSVVKKKSHSCPDVKQNWEECYCDILCFHKATTGQSQVHAERAPKHMLHY